MDVLKTTSPTASPSKPCPLPRKTRPSSSSNVAGLFILPGLWHTSIQSSHLAYRPISEDGFAVDVFLRHQSPHAAVVGLVSVITKNIVVAGLNINGRVGAMIDIVQVNIGLV